MMNARLSRTVLLVAATVVAAALAAIDGCAAAWELEAADFVLISGPASPRVAFAARRSADILLVALDISTFPPDAAASASLGLAAAGKVVVSEKDVVAAAARGKGSVRYLFAIPAAKLVEQKDDWVKLRMAVAVAWPGGPLGTDRQREQFRQAGFAAHAGLSGDPADWLPLDMDEYEAMVADRRNAIRIGFAQPMDGKATIVINDETGGRVRNLIAGQPMPKGKQESNQATNLVNDVPGEVMLFPNLWGTVEFERK